MMKTRIISVIVASALIICMGVSVRAAANSDSLTYGNYQYSLLSDGSVKIEKYNGYAESLQIPEKIDGKTVTAIEENAFENFTSLKNVTIPKSVTSVGSGAFFNTALYNDESNWEDGALYIGQNLISARMKVWNEEENKIDIVKEVDIYYDIKPGTKIIADNAFDGCEMKRITIPDSVEIIGNRAFSYCELIRSVVIPDSVKKIGTDAFFGCENLAGIEIGSGVTQINRNAFCNTAYWKGKFKWDNGVLYIGNYLISTKSDAELGDYAVKDGTKVIADNAFFSCKSLTGVTIPDSVTNIGENAFNNCTALESVNIPSSVESVGDYAFHRCTALKSVTIPSSITKIGEKAFGYNYKNGFIKIPDFHIDCYSGTAGEEYAAENELNYTSHDITVIFGDANNDGKVTANDVLLIRKNIAGQSVKMNTAAADVNCDGKLTATDVLMIRKSISGQQVNFGK